MLAAFALTLAVLAAPSDEARWHRQEVVPVTENASPGWTRAFPADSGRVGWGLFTFDKRLLVLSSGKLIALDPAGGRTIWTTPSPFRSEFWPFRDTNRGIERDGLLFLTAGSNEESEIIALEANTGRVRWRSKHTGWIMAIQPAGKSLACAVWTTSKSSRASFHHITLVSARSGSLVADLSPGDSAANRRLLSEKCPGLVDQYVIFDPLLIRNGVSVMRDQSFLIGNDLSIVDGYLYQRLEYEDYPMDLREMSALSGVAKFSLTHPPTFADLWKRRGMGRNYRNASGHFLGPIVGPYRGRLLTTLTAKRYVSDVVGVRSRSTLAAVSPLDPTDLVEIPSPIQADWINPYARTSLGFLFGARQGENERLLVVDDRGVYLQRALPRNSSPFDRWQYTGVCRSGVAFYSHTDLGKGNGQQQVHLEPLRVR